MQKFSSIILVLVSALLILNSCKKFTLPPKKAEPPISGTITIDSIIKKYENYYVSGNPTTYFKFPDDVNVTCTVTADEVSGNIYKSVFVQDATGSIQVKLINSGGLFVGDVIRINLKGVVLDDYAKMVQLDSIDIEKKVTKLSSGNPVVPLKVTINQLYALNFYGLSKYQARLVILDSVEFDVADKNQLYSNSVLKTSVDRNLINAFGKSVVVRTSGYSNFANFFTPCGKGQVTAVVSQYGTNTIQLTIRDVKEVKLSGGNCPYVSKNFEDVSLSSGGWTTYNVNGNICWTIGSFGNYANASNYVGGSNILCESWLISPSINLSAATNPVFNFKSAFNYTGPTLQVYVSTNYSVGNPTAATWTLLSPTLSAGAWAWTPSGNLSLSAYKMPNVHVAYKYTGTASAGSTWEIDDIGVIEN